MKPHFEQIKSATDNIIRYREKEVSISERMSANIDELALFVATNAAKDVRSKGFFTDDISLEAYMPPMIPLHEQLFGVLAENHALASAKLSASDSAYIADFCVSLTSKLKQTAKLKTTPALFTEGGISRNHGGKVAFAENRFFLSAFAVFSKKVQGLTSSYVRSFTDACNDVSAGVCDYCILPIENSREGTLVTVYSMIERHDLFIFRVCEIESEEITTKFALLCRRMHGIIDSQNRQRAEIRIMVRDSSLWSRIYTGAEVIGAVLEKTVAVPLVYTDGYAHICTFSGNNDALFAFLLFLSAIRVDYTLIGLYEESV